MNRLPPIAIKSSSKATLKSGLIESLPQLVGNLSPASRAVGGLFYLHELSLVETAAVLEIPVGTAKSGLAYGLESLRRTFQREEK